MLIFRERSAIVSAEADDDVCTRSRRRFTAFEPELSLGFDLDVVAEADRMFAFFVNDASCLTTSISFFWAALSAALRASTSTLKLLIWYVKHKFELDTQVASQVSSNPYLCLLSMLLLLESVALRAQLLGLRLGRCHLLGLHLQTLPQAFAERLLFVQSRANRDGLLPKCLEPDVLSLNGLYFGLHGLHLHATTGILLFQLDESRRCISISANDSNAGPLRRHEVPTNLLGVVHEVDDDAVHETRWDRVDQSSYSADKPVSATFT